MDVEVPEIPAEYNAYREQLQEFIAEHKPVLGWTPKTGARMPETVADLEVLRSWVATLHDAGYVLERFTETEVDPFEARILEQELTATGIPYILGNPLVSGALKMFGTPEQRAQYLPPMARGDHIWTQLFSEPDAGSDLTSLKTKARRDGDDYVVDGQKVWSTWAPFADYGYLLARSEPGPGAAGITAFVLDMHSHGVETRPLREMTGTTDFSEVFFDGVRVPAANVIGAPGTGWKVANASLAVERGGVGTLGSSGVVEGLVRLARARYRGGHPLIEDGAVRQKIAAFACRSRLQRYLGHRVMTKALHGDTAVWDAPLMKIWVSELNLEAVEYALALQGPRSARVEGDPDAVDAGQWQDSFLYARAWTIAGGSNEIMRNLIAERGLELPREPRVNQ
jgi:alkylation response protein AidB-like acyl-CoA dehydrogenase